MCSAFYFSGLTPHCVLLFTLVDSPPTVFCFLLQWTHPPLCSAFYFSGLTPHCVLLFTSVDSPPPCVLLFTLVDSPPTVFCFLLQWTHPPPPCVLLFTSVDSPPERMTFEQDNKVLKIRDVCQHCEDGERATDLMVIQCNSSNTHGYAFGQGYLNVLSKYHDEL